MKPLLAVLCLLAVFACSKPGFSNVDITGANYANGFSLTDHTGARRTLADYRGKLVVIFFGFTQCPDVCPTTMQEMAEARRQLGRDADQVQVLFVTIDPQPDTIPRSELGRDVVSSGGPCPGTGRSTSASDTHGAPPRRTFDVILAAGRYGARWPRLIV